MGRRSLRVACIVAGLLSPSLAAPEVPRGRAADLALAQGFPKITVEERALTEVPFAPRSPAVVLQDVLQNRWDALSKEIRYMRIDHHRRVKVLSPEGASRCAVWRLHVTGDEQVQKVEARTVLPDGRVVPARVVTQSLEAKRTDVTVTFEEVAPGAILDLRLSRSRPALFTLHRAVQEDLPVLLSRFVIVPPSGLNFAVVANNILQSAVEISKFRSAFGEGAAYTVRNLPALADEANLPPDDDVRQSLYFVPRSLDERVHTQSFLDVSAHFDFATTWEAWRRAAWETWEPWLNGQSGEVKALAKSAAAAATGTEERAEAVRRALQGLAVRRVERDVHVFVPERRAPDIVLAEGWGLPADVAGVHVAALRAAGLPAHLVATRRRESGSLIEGLVIPQQFDDMLVRVQTERGPLYYNPGATLAVGILPRQNRGALAMPIDLAATAPVPLASFTAAENRTVRRIAADLDLEGTMHGRTEEYRYGLAADELRTRMRGFDDAGRRAVVEGELHDSFPGAVVTECALEDGPEGVAIPFVKVTTVWTAPRVATREGGRLLLDLNRFGRVDRSQWSAASRRAPVDLRGPFDDADTMTIVLPEGITDLTLPPPVSESLGQAGKFSLQYQRIGNKLVRKRQTVLEQYRFAPEGWPLLRAWQMRMAEALDAPLVATLR